MVVTQKENFKIRTKKPVTFLTDIWNIKFNKYLFYSYSEDHMTTILLMYELLAYKFIFLSLRTKLVNKLHATN